MTGKDLIIYILQHNLLDTPISLDSCFLDMAPAKEVATRFNVGEATVEAWYEMGLMRGVRIGPELFIEYPGPIESDNDIKNGGK